LLQKALELETALLLPEIRLEKACTSYALRTLLFQKDYSVLQALYRPVQDELGPEDSDTGLLSYLEPSTSQLLNLAIRLQGLVGSNWNIDRLKAHWNPSWNTGVEATVVVSNSSKHKAVTEHNQLLKAVLNKTTIVAYTDGLQGTIPSLGTPTTSAGICLIGFEKVLQASCWNLGTEIEVANAEVVAINKALQATTRLACKPKYLYVFCNS
jgi:hypothetical protein